MQKQRCHQIVQKSAISISQVTEKINEDIDILFDKIKESIAIVDNNKHDLLHDKIIKHFFLSPNESIDTINLTHGVSVYLNKKTKKFSRIVIDSRNYDEEFESIIDEECRKSKKKIDKKSTTPEITSNATKEKIEKPEIVFSKQNDGENNYILHETETKKYIQKHLVSNEYMVVTLFGSSQMGKSEQIKILTGIDHETGNITRSITKGATIAYAGKIKDIYKRVDLKPPNNEYINREVFFIDTEGIYSDAKKGCIASLLLPFLVLSSKVVKIMYFNPGTSIANFLDLCKIYVNILDENNDDVFKDKLIVKAIDIPREYENDPTTEIKKNLDFLNNSEITESFRDISLYPQFVPGGPWNSKIKRHDPHFTQYFLDELFSNPKRTKVYTNADEFVESIKGIDYVSIKRLFEEKTTAEKTLKYICCDINDDIRRFFLDILDTMEYDEESINKFYKKQIELKLENVARKNSIPKKYIDKYLEKEKKIFNQFKDQFLQRVLKYKEFKGNVINAKTTKEKIYYQLQYISKQVQGLAQLCADHIFLCIENNFTKIDNYEKTIILFIENVKDHCLKTLNYLKIPISIIHENIKDDINSIFTKFCEFRTFTFYREHGIVSRVIKYFKDTIIETKNPKELIPGVLFYDNEVTGKFYKIEVRDRKYDKTDNIEMVEKFFNNKIFEKLDDSQKESFISEKSEQDNFTDMTYEQIDKLAIKYGKTIQVPS